MAVETQEQAHRRPPKIANTIAAMLLRSPLHGMLSNFLLLLTFTGRKSGKQYSIPVGYGRQGNTLALFTDNKWYKNLLVNPKVTVRLQGKERSGAAEVILDEKERTAQEMRAFVRNSKQAARAYGVTFDADGSVNQESLRKAAELWVLILVHLKGVENTLFPSFTPDLQELDEDGIRLDVRQSIAHGFTSMMCATEVGLRFDEAKRFVQIAADEAGDKIRVTASLLFDNFDQQFEMLEWGEKVGLHGYLLGFPPTYHPETSNEIYDMAKKMCAATNLAITVYPSPHFNFQRLHPAGYPLDVLTRLADVPNVVAMKVGELGLYADLYRRIGDRVLLGSPVERNVPLLMMGFGMQWMGAGCYEVFQSPEQPWMVEYFNLLLQGKQEAAMDLYWRLTSARVIFEQQFGATVMTGTYHWSQQKYYQWCVGGNGGVVRQPSMKLHQHEMDMTKMGFLSIGISPRYPDAEFYVGRLNYAKTGSFQSAGDIQRV